MMSINMKCLFLFMLIGHRLCNNQDSYILTVCQKKCQENSYSDVQQCMDICQSQKQKSNRLLISISLAVILLCISLCICCFICKHHKFRYFRLRFDKDFNSLRGQHQQQRQIMSRQQYSQHTQQILQLFQFSSYKQNFITYHEKCEQVEKVIVKEKRVSDFRYQIQIEGEDQDSEWFGSGEIVCTRKGVICWFFKQSKDDLLKRSKFMCSKSIYVSLPSNMDGLVGEWRSLRKKKQNKGSWKLKIPSSSADSEIQSCLNLHK